ncbi:hypothetical protein [Streptomyces sp. NPDC003480]
MRLSARIPSVLAGLVLALGGAAGAAPAAHADISACQDSVQSTGTEVTDAVRTACYHGLVGDESGCVSGLTQSGVPGDAAATVCRQASR